MNTSNCVVAYSGGLDTSAIVPWLVEQGYTVHCVLVDVGQDENLSALCEKAIGLGAATAVVRDAKPDMYAHVIPAAIALAATYEGSYRLGTALARPFIALEQVRRARELGGATLVHGATGKGNDQIRFEFAYRALMPEAPVLAPWKVWPFEGRIDLINYLAEEGYDSDYEAAKDFSLDENLWHLSVEGGPLEDPQQVVNVPEVLAHVADRFAIGGAEKNAPATVAVTFAGGVPVALNGQPCDLPTAVNALNEQYRHADWAWDLVIENRFTGIKSRGLYINPAAKLLHIAADALARSVLNKPTYDQYARLGAEYSNLLYRGEYFSPQRLTVLAAAQALMGQLNGEVTVQLTPAPYACRIQAADAIFSQQLATFEKSEYKHQDAQGFINLSYLSLIGRPFVETQDAGAVATNPGTSSAVCQSQPVPGGGLVPSSL